MKTKRQTRFGPPSTATVRYLALIAIIILLCILFAVLSPAFLARSNLMNIIRQTSVTLVVSISMTFIILTGGIDLSVGSNIAVSGMLGIVVLNATNSTLLAVLSTLVAATIFGAVNGLLVGKLQIAAFIVTLAMQFVGRGATMLLHGATSIKVNNPFYKLVGQDSIVGIPVILIIVAVLYVLFCVINDKTVFGRSLYAIGGNSFAARASGIHVENTLLKVYMLGGLVAGVGAIMTVGRMGSAQPYAGQGLEFSCITAVVLGGTSLEGGKGNLKGTVIGALLVGIVSNGLSMLGVEKFFEYVATGALVLIAVLTDMAITHYSNKRLIPKLSEEETQKAPPPAVEVDVEKIRGTKEHVVEMRGITKVFPGMRALDSVDFSVRPYEVQALMGENGAGKSTLMRILSGELPASSGAIFIDGQQVRIDSAMEAKQLGIALIHQEIALIPELTVAQNIFLGKEEKLALPLFLNNRKMNQNAQAILDKLGLKINVSQKASALTVSEQQMVEIAKALASDAWLIIMDEPTSSLSEREKDELFTIIERLKNEGLCVIYISHRMQEIFRICDKITILRDGQLVGVEEVSASNENKIISMMVGRELSDIFDRDRSGELGKPVLEVRNLCKRGVFHNISFTVHEREVVGFSGLVGAGRTEIARCIFGLDQPDSGEILLDGKPMRIHSPQDAIKQHVAYVPEDRKQDGFVPLMSIRDNIAMASYKELSSKLGFVKRGEEKRLSSDYIQKLGIKTTSMEKNVVELSGGNQQKVSLANRLAIKPEVLILDEPTRGIDIGAKAEIHKLIAEIASQGVAVILISSEMPELIGCANRVAVLREGVMTALLEQDELQQDRIMYYAAQH